MRTLPEFGRASLPLMYRCADGGTLCPACANGGNGSIAFRGPTYLGEPTEDRQWHIVASEHVPDEGATCDHCGDTFGGMNNPDEPDESDYVMSDVRGGVGVSRDGKYLGTFDDRDGAEDAIREDAGKNYRPGVWFVSDHGNAHRVDDFRWE